MSLWVVAILAGWLVLRILEFRPRWPWRVTDLVAPEVDVRPRRHGRPLAAGPERRGFTGRQQRQITAALPAAADLLRVAVSAGHNLYGAIAAAAEFGDGPVCEALGLAEQRYRRGASLVDELAALPERLGPATRSFAGTLVTAHSSGAPLAPALQRLADSERRRARRHIEERVRRLPILLLAPLIGLVLPAFVILTIVPVVLVTADIELAGPPSIPVSPASPPN